MNPDRDAGLEALQRGDVQSAVDLLERATQAAPDDYTAHMYLGAAYGQAGRHNDAVTVLTRAVQLQPANGQARYNLGIALERAGWREQALQALQQAVTLQPDYDKAREAVARLQGQPQQPAAPTVAMPAAQPTVMPQQSAGPMPLGGPAPLGGPTAQSGPVPLAGQPPVYSQPGAAPGYSQPSPYAPPSPYGPPPGAPGYAAPSYLSQPAYVEDKFDLAQAFKDWGQTLMAPARFFDEQVGRDGMKAPLAVLLAYSLITIIVTVIVQAIRGAFSGPAAAFIVGALLFAYPGQIIGNLFRAAILHAVGRMFGNSATFAGTFRAVSYSSAPSVVMGILGALAMLATPVPQTPGAMGRADTHVVLAQYQSGQGGGGIPQPPPFGGQPGQFGGQNGQFGGQPNPFGGPGAPNAQNPFAAIAAAGGGGGPITLVCALIGWIWSVVLLGMALARIQQTGTGGAIGTIVVAGLILGVIVVVLAVGLGAAVFAALMAGKGH